MKDLDQFKTQMQQLCAMFPTHPMTADLLAGYWEALADLTDEEFLAAARLCRRTSEFMPKPVHLLAAARPEADYKTEASKVFGQIVKCTTFNPATGEYVSAQKVETTHGRAARVAFEAVGGRDAWGDLQTPTMRLRDFVEVYVNAKQTEARDAERAKLTDGSRRLPPSSTPTPKELPE